MRIYILISFTPHLLPAPHPRHVEQLRLKLLEVVGVSDQHLHAAFKRSVAGVETDGAHVHVHRVLNDAGAGVDQSHVVNAGEVEADLELFGGTGRPLGFDDVAGKF